MKLPFKPDPLDALLAGFGYRLGMLAKENNAQFLKLVHDKDLAILFSSDDGVERYFRFAGGKFVQHQGRVANPDLSVHFVNSLQGAKILASGAPALMRAVQDKKVVITGDYSLVLWLGKLANLAKTVPQNLQPLVDKARPFYDKAKPYLVQAQKLFSRVFGK